jgi:hypothetical protein
MIYYYTKTKNPCVEMIRENVAASEMVEKGLLKFFDGSRTRDPVTRELQEVTFKVEFENELSVDDKAIFDGLVDESLDKHKVNKNARVLLGDLFEACADQGQQMRLLAALDKRPSFDRAIQNQNFELAHTIKGLSFADGDINQDDVDLIDQKIPASKWIS